MQVARRGARQVNWSNAIAGANYAYNLGRRLNQGYRVAKRVYNSYSSQNNGSARKKSKPVRAAGTTAVVNRTGVSTRQASKRGKFKRKGPKRVKVSKSLRKKINKVIDDDEGYLTGTHISVTRPQIERQETDNKRTWFCYPYAKDSSGNNPGNQYSVLHSWAKIVYCAQRLFDSNATTTSREFMNPSQDEDYLPFKSSTIEVLYNKATYWFRNNSKRTYFLNMYKCTAKQNMGDPDTPLRRWFESSLGEQVAAADTPEKKADKFVESLENGVYTGLTSVDTYRQIISDIYMNPRYIQQFRKYYDMEEIKMVIEPGQTVTQVVQLPVGEMTGVDYFTDTSYQAHHKGSVTVMFSILADVTSFVPLTDYATVGKAGYYADPDGALNGGGTGIIDTEGGIIMDCKVQRKIKMPAKAPWHTVSTGALGDNAVSRRNGPRYYMETYVNTIAESGVHHRVDEQNPEATMDADDQ